MQMKLISSNIEPDLHDYDIIIINSSGGKDSQCAIWEVCRIAAEQGYDKSRIIVSHQDLGRVEWPGVLDLVRRQSEFFGLRWVTIKRVDSQGDEIDLLEHVRRHGKWPGGNSRYCTSDHKRGPGEKKARALAKEHGASKVLYVFGFRAQESTSRAKKQYLSLHKGLTIKKRTVMEWNPILYWKKEKVWKVIKQSGMPYHRAYDLGMPRLSCVFCVFAPKSALIIAGKENPELLQQFIDVEKEIGHEFKHNEPISEIQQLIAEQVEVQMVEDWNM